MTAKLTILLPTYNRSDYLARQLDYLSKHFDSKLCSVSVLDGSSEKDQMERNRILCDDHRATYSWHDSTIHTGYGRFAAGLKNVETPYVIFIPDDDYYLFETITECIETLDTDPMVVGAYGSDIVFQLLEEGSDTPRTVQLMSIGTDEKLDYCFDSALARVFYAVAEVQRSTYFCVYRKEVFARAIDVALEYAVFEDGSHNPEFVDSQCFFFGDVLVGLVPMLHGKIRHVGKPVCAYQLGQSFDNEKRKHFGQLTLDPNFRYIERATGFVDAMVSETISADIHSDSKILREFYTNLVATFVGRVALTNGLIPSYNTALAEHAVDLAIYVPFLDTVQSPTVPIQDDLSADSETTEALQTVHDQYGVVLNHLAGWCGVSELRHLQLPYPEDSVYKALHSRQRPVPFGTAGDRREEPPSAPADEELPKSVTSEGFGKGIRAFFRRLTTGTPG